MKSAGYRHMANERGAVLLIVLVMVVIMGLTLGIAGSSWKSTVQRAREKELFWRGDQYRKAIQSYFSVRQGKTPGMFPQELDDLVQDPRFPGVVRHIRRLYKDPMTDDDWVVIKDQAGRITGVRSSSELEPFKKENFPEGYDKFEGADSYSRWEFVFVPKVRKRGVPENAPAEPPGSEAPEEKP